MCRLQTNTIYEPQYEAKSQQAGNEGNVETLEYLRSVQQN